MEYSTLYQDCVIIALKLGANDDIQSKAFSAAFSYCPPLISLLMPRTGSV